MRPEWVAAIRDQCRAAGVPFFFKQWGGVRKKANGRELDGPHLRRAAIAHSSSSGVTTVKGRELGPSATPAPFPFLSIARQLRNGERGCVFATRAVDDYVPDRGDEGPAAPVCFGGAGVLATSGAPDCGDRTPL